MDETKSTLMATEKRERKIGSFRSAQDVVPRNFVSDGFPCTLFEASGEHYQEEVKKCIRDDWLKGGGRLKRHLESKLRHSSWQKVIYSRLLAIDKEPHTKLKHTKPTQSSGAKTTRSLSQLHSAVMSSNVYTDKEEETLHWLSTVGEIDESVARRKLEGAAIAFVSSTSTPANKFGGDGAVTPMKQRDVMSMLESSEASSVESDGDNASYFSLVSIVENGENELETENGIREALIEAVDKRERLTRFIGGTHRPQETYPTLLDAAQPDQYSRFEMSTVTMKEINDQNQSSTWYSDSPAYKQKVAVKKLLDESKFYHYGEHHMQAVRTEIKLKQALEKGVLYFNHNPKTGIDYLIKEGIIINAPNSIIMFLHLMDGLDKRAIGRYLGDRKLPDAIRTSYCELFDFSGMNLLEALRYFLSKFHLAGESQVIERIIFSFAASYLRDNPGFAMDQTDADRLSYSLIMLNSFLHNPNVKQRVSKADFISMMNGAGLSLGKEELDSMYDSINAVPFKPTTSESEQIYKRLAENPSVLKRVEAASSQIDYDLLKKGGNFIKYGRRGKPHVRRISLDGSGEYITWSKVRRERKQNGVHTAGCIPVNKMRKRGIDLLGTRIHASAKSSKSPTTVEDRVDKSDKEKGEETDEVKNVRVVRKSTSDSEDGDISSMTHSVVGQQNLLRLMVHFVLNGFSVSRLRTAEIRSSLMELERANRGEPLNTEEAAPPPPLFRRLVLDELLDIRVGRNASHTMSRQRIAKELDVRCISLVTKGRTLDFYAPEDVSPPLSTWTAFFHSVLQKNLQRRMMKTVETLELEVGKRIAGEEKKLITWRETIIPQWKRFWRQGNDGTRMTLSPMIAVDRALLDRFDRVYCADTLLRYWHSGIPQSCRGCIWVFCACNGCDMRVEQFLELGSYSEYMKERYGGLDVNGDIKPRRKMWRSGNKLLDGDKSMPASSKGYQKEEEHIYEKWVAHLFQFREMMRAIQFTFTELHDLSAGYGVHEEMGVEFLRTRIRMKRRESLSVTSDKEGEGFLMEDGGGLWRSTVKADKKEGVRNGGEEGSANERTTSTMASTLVTYSSSTSNSPLHRKEGNEVSASSEELKGGAARSSNRNKSVKGTEETPHSSHITNGAVEEAAQHSTESLDRGHTASTNASPGDDNHNVLIEGGRENAEDRVRFEKYLEQDTVFLETVLNESEINVVRGYPEETIACTVQNIIERFILSKPDIGYVQGMSRIVTLLVYHMNAPLAFAVFSNFFRLSFLKDLYIYDKAARRNVQLRINLFVRAFQERLPDLYSYFGALSVTPETYLLPWVLNLFTQSLPLPAVCRLWDRIFLYGETYILSAALGLLLYHTHALQSSSFDGCIRLLHSLPSPELFEETLFFACVENCLISPDEIRELHNI